MGRSIGTGNRRGVAGAAPPTRGPATSSPSFLTSCTRIAGMAVAGRRRPLCPCLGAALP